MWLFALRMPPSFARTDRKRSTRCLTCFDPDADSPRSPIVALRSPAVTRSPRIGAIFLRVLKGVGAEPDAASQTKATREATQQTAASRGLGALDGLSFPFPASHPANRKFLIPRAQRLYTPPFT